MSFVAQLQIALHLHSFKTILFKNQGLIRFRLALFHRLNNNQSRSLPCLPYQILNKPSPDKEWLPSLINKQDNSYHSQALSVRLNKQDYTFDEICLFKAEIPMERMEEVEIICNAELFFSPEAMFSVECVITQDYSEFESLASYDGKISKVSKIAEYMCISFDDFQGFRVNASYSATIQQFKFVENKNSEYRTFAEYVQASTDGFLKKQTKMFYSFYKKAMEEELHFLREKIEGVTNVHGSMIFGVKKSKILTYNNNKVDFEIEKLSHQQTHISNPLIRKILDFIIQDLLSMKKQSFQLWRRYLTSILQNSNKIISLGRTYFEIASKQRLKCHIFSHEIKSFDPTESKYQDVGKQHLQQASNEKKKFIKQASPVEFNIQNIKYYPLETKAPKLFEEIYYTGRKPGTQRVGGNALHVFILVHGFQATRKDMELFRVMLETSVGNCQIMVSCHNEGKTQGSIQKLASNFASQVTNYLLSLGKIQYKVSFIGHSMGGIIIRAGLQYLSQFYHRFWTFASLSSPHLGYLAHNSQIVNAGLWYLNTWQKCQSISQLAMSDSTQLQNTFLYKLSKDPNLKHFQNVAFISSYQDSYVSFESARVEKTGKIIQNALKKDRNCQALCEMSQNIIGNLNCVKFSRIDVIFDIQENNLDSLIGRTAHVKLLSDKGFVKILIQVFENIFR